MALLYPVTVLNKVSALFSAIHRVTVT